MRRKRIFLFTAWKSHESLALDIKAYVNHELPIPYMVDVINYSSLKQTDLKEHIDRVGIIFFSKNKAKADSKGQF